MILPVVQVIESLGYDLLYLSLCKENHTGGLYIRLESKVFSSLVGVLTGL